MKFRESMFFERRVVFFAEAPDDQPVEAQGETAPEVQEEQERQEVVSEAAGEKIDMVKEMSGMQLDQLKQWTNFNLMSDFLKLGDFNFGEYSLEKGFGPENFSSKIYVKLLQEKASVLEMKGFLELFGDPETVSGEEVAKHVAEIYAVAISVDMEQQYEKYKAFFDENPEAKKQVMYSPTQVGDGFELTFTNLSDEDKKKIEEIGAKEDSQESMTGDVKARYEALKNSGWKLMAVTSFVDVPEGVDPVMHIAQGKSLMGNMMAGMLGIPGFEGFFDALVKAAQKAFPAAVPVLMAIKSAVGKAEEVIPDFSGDKKEEATETAAENSKSMKDGDFDDLRSKGGMDMKIEGVTSFAVAEEIDLEGKEVMVDLSDIDGEAKMSLKDVAYKDPSSGGDFETATDKEFGKDEKIVLKNLKPGVVIPSGAKLSLIG